MNFLNSYTQTLHGAFRESCRPDCTLELMPGPYQTGVKLAGVRRSPLHFKFTGVLFLHSPLSFSVMVIRKWYSCTMYCVSEIKCLFQPVPVNMGEGKTGENEIYIRMKLPELNCNYLPTFLLMN